MSATRGVEWSEEVGISPGGKYKFPRAPGVYVFAQVYAEGYDVRYVGLTGNLDERISAHLDGDNENDCLQVVLANTPNVKIRAAVQRDKDERANLEYTCYKIYSDLGHRLCNASKPRGRLLVDTELPF